MSEEILISEEEFLEMQGDEELISQLLDYTKQKKRADDAIKTLKKELLMRVNKSESNLSAGEYSVVKTTRKGIKSLNKELVLEFLKDMGADEESFFKTGKNSESIKVVRNKAIKSIKIKK